MYMQIAFIYRLLDNVQKTNVELGIKIISRNQSDSLDVLIHNNL